MGQPKSKKRVNKTSRIMRCLLSTSVALFVFSVSGAALAESGMHEKEAMHANEKHAEHAVHWGYEGEGAPEKWGEIKEEFKTCHTGKTQSPVNLVGTVNANLPDLEINYKEAPLTILNNGHTVQVNVPEGSTLTVDGTVFHLLQLHFHTPSEHVINGKPFDMELHFVHKTDDGQLGVLGVMITEGQKNEEAAKIWAHMPMKKAEAHTYDEVSVNGAGLLPEKLGYYRLMGSLTTPPCSEGVNWHVLAHPIEFSKEQIDQFKHAFSMNARPVQDTNSRLIVIDKD